VSLVKISATFDPTDPAAIRDVILSVLTESSDEDEDRYSKPAILAATAVFRDVYLRLSSEKIPPTLAYLFSPPEDCECEDDPEDEDEDCPVDFPPEVLALLVRLLASKS